MNQIVWTGRIFEPGQPYQSVAPYGLAGEFEGVRMAMRFRSMSLKTIMEAADKIQFAIRLQLEAEEKKAKAQISRADTTRDSK
jgi:hypothetical protein